MNVTNHTSNCFHHDFNPRDVVSHGRHWIQDGRPAAHQNADDQKEYFSKHFDVWWVILFLIIIIIIIQSNSNDIEFFFYVFVFFCFFVLIVFEFP